MNTKRTLKAVVFLLLLCITLMGCTSAKNGDFETTKDTTSTTVITTTKASESTTKNGQKSTTKATTSSTTKSTSSTTKSSTTSTTKKAEKTTKKGNQSTTKKEQNTTTSTTASTTKSQNCSITIECKEILKNIDDLAPGHANFVPQNGYILSNYEYKISGKATVYNVLKKACDDNNINLTTRNSQYGIYIVGINNLDEKDCGSYSGWLYSVNGERPNRSCDKITVKNGDKIVFSYTCSY